MIATIESINKRPAFVASSTGKVIAPAHAKIELHVTLNNDENIDQVNALTAIISNMVNVKIKDIAADVPFVSDPIIKAESD